MLCGILFHPPIFKRGFSFFPFRRNQNDFFQNILRNKNKHETWNFNEDSSPRYANLLFFADAKGKRDCFDASAK